VIVLIDEYDVPLEAAYSAQDKFYDKMIGFIRSLLESAIKTNDCLQFSVLTGCLRISKESLFTGLNNLETCGVLNPLYIRYFGFTEAETDQIFGDFQLQAHRRLADKWYNGYLFGKTRIFNPWSVLNFVKSCLIDPETLPRAYWANTSGNELVKELIRRSRLTERAQLEELMAGKTISVEVHEETVYADLYGSPDNLWNLLLFTGYLTYTEMYADAERGGAFTALRIPNTEVYSVYKNIITKLFDELPDLSDLSALYAAIGSGEPEKTESVLSALLFQTISFFDYSAEGFYHGFMAGVLSQFPGVVQSNREAGLDRPDIILKCQEPEGKAIVMEFKYAKSLDELNELAQRARGQILEQRYMEGLRSEGFDHVIAYALVFFKKRCKVVLLGADS
jgi:hypothetical protein